MFHLQSGRVAAARFLVKCGCDVDLIDTTGNVCDRAAFFCHIFISCCSLLRGTFLNRFLIYVSLILKLVLYYRPESLEDCP